MQRHFWSPCTIWASSVLPFAPCCLAGPTRASGTGSTAIGCCAIMTTCSPASSGRRQGVRRILYAAVAGHHGGPPEHLDYRKSKDQAHQIGAEASRIAGEAIEAVAPLFPGASLDGIAESEARSIVVGVVRAHRSSRTGSARIRSGLVRKTRERQLTSYWKQALVQG